MENTDRQTYIGGSDAPVILLGNKAKWSSPYQLWLEKTGKVVPEDISNKPWIEWGTLLESKILEKFQKDTGFKVEPGVRLQHPKYPFIAGSLDGLGVDNDGIKFVFEAKTSRFGQGWDDGNIPYDYQIQVAHYMMLANCPYAYICVLIGGSDYHQYKLLRDYELEKMLLDAEVKFWTEYVEKDTPPPLETEDDIKLAYPKEETGTVVQADAEINEIALEYFKNRARIKELEARNEELQLQLQLFMKDAETLETEYGKFSFKTVSQMRFQQSEFKSKYPDLFNEFVQAVNSRRFTPYPKKGGF